MTFLQALLAFGAYVVLGTIVALAALTVYIQFHGIPPLLDGTPLGSVLDDRDRAHLLEAHDRDEDRVCNAFALELEEIRNLPTIEPWNRWSA